MKEGLSAFSRQLGQQFANDVYSIVKSAGSSAATITQSGLEIGFSDFVSANVERCRFVKTIINRYERVDIYDIYEDLSLSLGNETYSDVEIVTNEKYRRVIVTGTAGSGKSFLMRRAFLRMVEVNYGVFPIFLELRGLNSFDSPDIMQYIFSFLEPHVANPTAALLNRLFKSGKILLLLDGYDELYESVRERVSKQIHDLAYKFPNCRIIVSGRPDDTFSAWHAFDEYRIDDLSKQQCLSLIGKAIFPAEQRTRFRTAVDETLFDSHGEYLCNPLITYVMLMTADQFSDFPDEMSSFYSKAFETLYSGHDLIKSGDFRRQVKCNMKIREMEKVLQYFCALSYVDGHYQYSDETLRKYLTLAMGLSKVSFDEDNLVYDLVKSYCLLIVDGTSYSYIHRTFQEYFAAICVTQSERIDYFAYNTKVVTQKDKSASYIKLLMEVGKEKLQERYLIPTLNDYLSEVRPLIRDDPREFLLRHLYGIGIDLEGYVRVLTWSGLGGNWWGFVTTFLPIYKPEVFRAQFFLIKEDIESLTFLKSVPLVDDRDSVSEYYDLEFASLAHRSIRKLQFFKTLVAAVSMAGKELDSLTRDVSEDKQLASTSKKGMKRNPSG